MNSIEAAFIGRVTSEAIELKTSQAGKPWAAFNVAVGKDDDTQWVRVAMFGEMAERLTGHLVKGDKVYIEGTLRLNEWTSREGKPRSGLSVAASKVEVLGKIGRQKPAKPRAPPEGEHAAGPEIGARERPVQWRDDGDPIPFAPEWRG